MGRHGNPDLGNLATLAPWFKRVGLMLSGGTNAGAVYQILMVRSRAVGGDPSRIRVERGRVETRSRFGWTPIGDVREIRNTAKIPGAYRGRRGSLPKSNPLSCWNCRTSLRAGQDICPTCSAGQYEENPIRSGGGRKPSKLPSSFHSLCRECFERPGTSQEVPGLCHWCANLVTGDLEAERRELGSVREFPEMENPVAVEAYHGKGTPIFVEPSRQIGSNPSCKRCHGNCQVRLGKNVIPCPMCQRKHKRNPLDDGEARQVMKDVKWARRMGTLAPPESKGYFRGLAVGKMSVVSEHGPRTLAHRRRIRVAGEKIEFAQTLDAGAGHPVDRRGLPRIKRNPLDSHKPGCRCIFHSGKIFQKGPKK